MRDAQAVSAMLCPVCHAALSMTDRQGLEIDLCPQCRVVWLDGGTRQDHRAIRAGRGASCSFDRCAQLSADRDYRDDRRYSTKRKKSFLEALFD